MEKTINELMEAVKVCKTYLGKSEMTSGNAYRVTITKGNAKIWFVFNDNYKNESNINDFIYCLCLDSEAYENCYNFADFCNEFGYDTDSRKAYYAYKACQKQSFRLHKLFTDSEIEIISEFARNY